MKVYNTALLASLVAAAPAELERRQGKGKLGGGGGSDGICFVFARGSTEPSPIGFLIGPQLQSALRAKFPGMTTVPVLYAASIGTNVSVQRTDQASINKGATAFKEANGKCKIIVAGGYSQGAAVMHNVIEKSLDASIKEKIAGVALFGDTRNKQDGGHIKNFPQERSRVWCNKSDGVCGGGLTVNAGHLSYSGADIKASANWLAERVSALKSGGGGKISGPSEGGAAAAKGLGGKGGLGGKAGGAKEGAGKMGGMMGKSGGKGLGGKGKSSGGESAEAPAVESETTTEAAGESAGEAAEMPAAEAMGGHSHGRRSYQ